MILGSTIALASRGRLSILIFHRVLPAHDPLFPGEPDASEFDALLAHLAKRFRILPLAQAVDRLYEGTLPRAALAITFDDGYADNLTVAGPILSKHGFPATLFIATGYLDGGVMWNDVVIAAFRSSRRDEVDLDALGLGRHMLASDADRRLAIDRVLRDLKYRPSVERDQNANAILDAADVERPRDLMLTSDGVRSLPQHGIDVGAHTITHPILANTDADVAWREIRESKRALEQIVGHAVTLFAYPNGRPDEDYKAEHVRMVKEAGFTAAVSTAWGVAKRSSDRMQLPRFTPWTRNPVRFDLLMLRNLHHSPEREAATC
jgi:peptidoglycan/xylan/chitin deacetylase (PgdA/CDA1 family)